MTLKKSMTLNEARHIGENADNAFESDVRGALKVLNGKIFGLTEEIKELKESTTFVITRKDGEIKEMLEVLASIHATSDIRFVHEIVSRLFENMHPSTLVVEDGK